MEKHIAQTEVLSAVEDKADKKEGYGWIGQCGLQKLMLQAEESEDILC